MASDEYLQERKGFWHEPAGTPTTEANAMVAWAHHAHAVLTEVAGEYHAVLQEHELADRLQAETGIHTTRPFVRWLDKVLVPLAALCERDGEPPLTSLVVSPEVDDLPAARRRLECYQWAGSAPADGGEPKPLRVMAGGRPRAAARPARSSAPRVAREKQPPAPKRVAKTDRPIAVCPTCFMALPATGVCDNCG